MISPIDFTIVEKLNFILTKSKFYIMTIQMYIPY